MTHHLRASAVVAAAARSGVGGDKRGLPRAFDEATARSAARTPGTQVCVGATAAPPRLRGAASRGPVVDASAVASAPMAPPSPSLRPSPGAPQVRQEAAPETPELQAEAGRGDSSRDSSEAPAVDASEVSVAAAADEAEDLLAQHAPRPERQARPQEGEPPAAAETRPKASQDDASEDGSVAAAADEAEDGLAHGFCGGDV